jgi:hypothetical protein
MINGGQASHYIRGHLNSRVWVITALCILALVSLLVTLQTYKYSYDDAYITYRYASRLDTGLGFNYHTGETHSGTTAPGYALLLAILALPDPAAIPQISGWVGGISLLFVGIAVFLFGLRHKQPLTGFIASLVFIVCPYSLLTMGGEMLTMTALVMLGILAYDQDHPKLAGALIGFACVIRGDAALAGVILAVHSLLFRRKFPWGLAFGALISVLPWSIYAYFRYGSPLPNTLSIKIIQGQSGHWSHFLLGFIKYFAGELGISNRSEDRKSVV